MNMRVDWPEDDANVFAVVMHPAMRERYIAWCKSNNFVLARDPEMEDEGERYHTYVAIIDLP